MVCSIVILLIVAYIWFVKHKYATEFFALIALLVLLTAFCIAGGIGSAIWDDNAVDTVVSSKELYALNDTSELYGSFFLGCGKIDSRNYYYYISKEQYGYQSNKMYIDPLENNIYIVITETTPSVEKHVISSTSHSLWAFVVGVKKYTVFNIPDGSLVNDYSIDME
jgi:hypothetical protein